MLNEKGLIRLYGERHCERNAASAVFCEKCRALKIKVERNLGQVQGNRLNVFEVYLGE